MMSSTSGTTESPSTATASVGAALAKIPSGCAILTSRQGGQRAAMVASWYQQAAFEPPSVTVAVRKGRPIAAVMDASGRFALNLLGEDAWEVMRRFSGGGTAGSDGLEGMQTTELDGGIALNEAAAVLACRITSKTEAGDHWVYVGAVTAATARPDATPHVHLRRNGLSY